MADENWDSRQMIARAASVAAVWGVSKLLATPQGQYLSEALDQKMGKVGKKMEKKAKKVKRNAKHSPVLLGVGVLALAAAVVMVARAASTD